MFRVFLLLAVSIIGAGSLLAKECVYEYSQKDTILEWTAFKFTEKTGVKGNLKKFDVIASGKVARPEEILKSIKFKINTGSVNTGNPERDAKIIKYFFSAMKMGNEIAGSFVSFKGKATGNVISAISMNGVTKNVSLNYEIKENVITISGNINLEKWQAEKAIHSLNEQCNDLHKGKDGKSKLWPDVDIKIVSTLSEVCK